MIIFVVFLQHDGTYKYNIFFYTSNNIWYAFYYIEENIQFFFKIFLEKTLDD